MVRRVRRGHLKRLVVASRFLMITLERLALAFERKAKRIPGLETADGTLGCHAGIINLTDFEGRDDRA